jgi:hypothetical protein
VKQCKTFNCESTDLVYSGVAAFTLGGIPTETYCYRCGNAYAMIKKDIEEMAEAYRAAEAAKAQ